MFRGGIAVGNCLFTLALKFLLLVTVRQSMVDEMTQDCYFSVIEQLLFATTSLPPCHFCLSHRLVPLASQSEPACVRHHPNECWSSQVPFSHKQGSCSSVGERGKVDASIMSNNSV